MRVAQLPLSNTTPDNIDLPNTREIVVQQNTKLTSVTIEYYNTQGSEMKCCGTNTQAQWSLLP